MLTNILFGGLRKLDSTKTFFDEYQCNQEIDRPKLSLNDFFHENPQLNRF